MPNDKANSGALNVTPGDFNDGDHRREPTFSDVRRTTTDPNGLVALDRDAEQVAFQLWREGRKDEAIAFLEREILLERDFAWKREGSRREPPFSEAAPEVIVPPPPGSRRRRRLLGAPPVVVVSEPAFSDASAPMIELAAEPVADRRALSGRPPRASRGSQASPRDDRSASGRAHRLGPSWIAAIAARRDRFAGVATTGTATTTPGRVFRRP